MQLLSLVICSCCVAITLMLTVSPLPLMLAQAALEAAAVESGLPSRQQPEDLFDDTGGLPSHSSTACSGSWCVAGCAAPARPCTPCNRSTLITPGHSFAAAESVADSMISGLSIYTEHTHTGGWPRSGGRRRQLQMRSCTAAV